MKNLLQRAYPYVPVFLQNVGISAYGYVYKRERFGSAFAPTCAEFAERDRWDPDRMQAHLTATLRTVLRRAFDAPFYRDHWLRAGIREADLAEMTPQDLPRLPLLAKEALRRAPMDFVPDRGMAVRGLLSYFSSGSTGTPIRAICTRAGQQRFAAAREVRSYNWAGTSIRRPRAMVGGQPIIPAGSSGPPYHRYNYAERQVYLSAYHISPHTIGDYVRGINRCRPELFTGYAFSQYEIARLMHEHNLTVASPLRAAITSSEALTPTMREMIRRSWGCRAYQEYGSVESCGLATECEFGSMHVHPDFGIVEVVDDDGAPVPPGVEGRIVCTGLLNEAQFLVRYEIGDTAIWSGDPCPCGRAQLPVLSAVTGRVEDAVTSLDGRQLVRFHGIFISVPFVVQGQVVQEAVDEFTVRVVVEDGYTEVQTAEIRQRMVARLGSVNVKVERVTALERNGRGKVRAVINNICG